MRKSFLEINWEIPHSFERIADISTAAREPSSDRGALCITVTVLLLKRRSKAKRVIRPISSSICAREGRAPACAGSRLRARCLVVRDARHSGISVWCRPARPNYNPVRLCFARGLRLDRGDYSRSSRRLHRSHASTLDGVGNALQGCLSGRV